MVPHPTPAPPAQLRKESLRSHAGDYLGDTRAHRIEETKNKWQILLDVMVPILWQWRHDRAHVQFSWPSHDASRRVAGAMCNRASSFQGRNLLTHSIALVRFPGRECSEFFPVMHHLLVDCVTIFAVVAVLLKPAGASCPQHHGSDPSDANDRIKKLENQK